MREVTISQQDYELLLEAQIRIDIFRGFVNGASYSISREECADFLGFELDDEQEED